MEIAPSKPHFSIPSIIALVAVIASFYVSPGSGFLLAMVAIVFGVIGFLIALAPSVRGGMVSIFSFVLGCVAVVAAIIRAFVHR